MGATMQVPHAATLCRVASLVRAMAAALIALFETLRGNLPPEVRDQLAEIGVNTARRIRRAASIFARAFKRRAP